MNSVAREDRAADELRDIVLEPEVPGYAEGACRIRCGRTEVLCSATVEAGVPRWRQPSGVGWVTAEYAMLPRATHERTRRERGQLGGRTQEIQRLIGRSLRATVDFQALGLHTVIIDCDVLAADGGTRTASITGAAVALYRACAALAAEGRIESNPIRELVAAVSVGVVGGQPRLDLDYPEDSTADVDMNLVALESGGFVEVQGTAEGAAFQREELDTLLDLGSRGIAELFALQRAALGLTG